MSLRRKIARQKQEQFQGGWKRIKSIAEIVNVDGAGDGAKTVGNFVLGWLQIVLGIALFLLGKLQGFLAGCPDGKIQATA
jgi:hypothetical protein